MPRAEYPTSRSRVRAIAAAPRVGAGISLGLRRDLVPGDGCHAPGQSPSHLVRRRHGL